MMSAITYQLRFQSPTILNSLCILLGVFDQYVDNHIILAILCSQICSLLVVATLPAHRNGSFQVKLQFPWGFDERVQLFCILELCIAIQKQCRVVYCCLIMVV